MLYAAQNRQAHPSAAAAQAHAQECAADLSAVVAALHGRIPSVTGASLLIAGFAALQLSEQIRIIRIVWLKCTGRPGMVKSDRIVADSVVCKCTVIIPLSSSVLYLFQDIEAFPEIAVLDIVEC